MVPIAVCRPSKPALRQTRHGCQADIQPEDSAEKVQRLVEQDGTGGTAETECRVAGEIQRVDQLTRLQRRGKTHRIGTEPHTKHFPVAHVRPRRPEDPPPLVGAQEHVPERGEDQDCREQAEIQTGKLSGGGLQPRLHFPGQQSEDQERDTGSHPHAFPAGGRARAVLDFTVVHRHFCEVSVPKWLFMIRGNDCGGPRTPPTPPEYRGGTTKDRRMPSSPVLRGATCPPPLY